MKKIPVKRSSKILLYKTLCSVIVLCLWNGCKSPAGISSASSASLSLKSDEAVFASVLDHSFRFNTLSARIKVDLNSEQKEMSATAQLKMVCGERMQLSIQPFFGIELFRIELTHDSVKMLDRMNKRYMAESIEALKADATIDFNFHNLQSLLTGALFIPGEQEISPKQMRRFRITKDLHAAHLNIKDEDGRVYTFTTDGEEQLRSTSVRDKTGKYRVTWDYSDYQSVGKQRFPYKMKAAVAVAPGKQTSLALAFSDAVVNRPLNTEFSVPAGYKRESFSQIFKWLNKQ
ncbi:MAG: DUF4292 domain-containing protein [Bacteroidales bacterium]|jgi:hypothetical protein|nr:DUF4292 domain-containing protein [Bacteroidales bacterium]